MYRRFMLFTLLSVLAGCQPQEQTAVPPPAVTETPCARDCLEDIIENYLQALAARDPSRIDVTDDLVFSENNQLLSLGDGSWQTMSGSGSYRHYFADPEAQQVAVISTMRENGLGVIYDLRLRLENRRIAEIESMVIRTPASAALYEQLGEQLGGPPPNFQQIIPEQQRVGREQLLMLPYRYLNGMENNDPYGDYSFFAPDCNRYEHALKTTNNEPMHVGHTDNTTFSTMTCEAQFSGGGLAFVTRIRDERYTSRMVVDEEKQAVFGFVFLDHNGTVHSITRTDGSVSVIPPYFSTPRSLMVGEAWRVRGDKLLEIEMTLSEIPYGERPISGLQRGEGAWLIQQDLNPHKHRLPEDCDRQCLDQVTRDFLTALRSHDFSQLPLSSSVHYRENGQQLAVGDGLWGTVSEIGDYQVLLGNPQTGKAGFFGTITEHDVPGLLSARLQIDKGLIQDINVTVMRHEYNTARGGTLSLFYPQIEQMFDPVEFSSTENELLQWNSASTDAMVASVSALHADKRESVMLLADAERGLVLQQSILDVIHDDSVSQTTGMSGSYSVLSTELYKFVDNELVLSRSVKRPMPYRMPL